jgi:hypothetical protein
MKPFVAEQLLCILIPPLLLFVSGLVALRHWVHDHHVTRAPRHKVTQGDELEALETPGMPGTRIAC